jgi:hypothetical protein
VSFFLGVGILAGVGMSAWTSRFAAALLYGVTPTDPAPIVGAAAILGMVAGIAGWFPPGVPRGSIPPKSSEG